MTAVCGSQNFWIQSNKPSEHVVKRAVNRENSLSRSLCLAKTTQPFSLH